MHYNWSVIVVFFQICFNWPWSFFFFFFLYYVCVLLRTVLRNNLLVSQTANTSKTGIIICVYWQVKKCCDSVPTDRFEWFSVTFIIKPSHITPFCARTGKCSHGVQQLSSLILNKSQRWQQKQFRDYITDLISVKQDEEVIYRHWEQARPSGLKLFSNHYSSIYCAFGFECWNSVLVWGQLFAHWNTFAFVSDITLPPLQLKQIKTNTPRYSLKFLHVIACLRSTPSYDCFVSTRPFMCKVEHLHHSDVLWYWGGDEAARRTKIYEVNLMNLLDRRRRKLPLFTSYAPFMWLSLKSNEVGEGRGGCVY